MSASFYILDTKLSKGLLTVTCSLWKQKSNSISSTVPLCLPHTHTLTHSLTRSLTMRGSGPAESHLNRVDCYCNSHLHNLCLHITVIREAQHNQHGTITSSTAQAKEPRELTFSIPGVCFYIKTHACDFFCCLCADVFSCNFSFFFISILWALLIWGGNEGVKFPSSSLTEGVDTLATFALCVCSCVCVRACTWILQFGSLQFIQMELLSLDKPQKIPPTVQVSTS